MNKYVKQYLLRGLIFGGFGPIVLGIIYLILQCTDTPLNLNGYEVCLGIVSTYVIAFVHAGSSVFPTIESWSKIKAMFVQGFSIWAIYLVAYLINSWIPLSVLAISLYTGCFFGGFLLIWLIVFLVMRSLSKKMNEKLKNNILDK